MAGLLSGLLGDNPIYKGFDQRRNSIGRFGLGLMQGKTPQEGLTYGVGGMLAGKEQDDAFATQQKAEAERLKGINSTVEFMRQKGYNDLVAGVEGGGLDMATAWGEALKRSSPAGATQDWSRLNDGTLYNQRTGEFRAAGEGMGGGSTEYGLTPVYGQFPDGTYGMGVLGKNGTFKPIDTGEMQVFDPRTLASERAAGTETGKFGAGQENTLPSVQIAVANAKNTINSIRNNTRGQEEQFGGFLGIPQQMLPMIPGSARANLDVDIQQLSGQAFLQAREFLKGQGQITDFESGKAEAAISRAQVAAQKGDRAAFNRALDDFEAALDAGLAKVAAQAGRSARPAPAPVGQTSTGLQWSIE